MVELPAGINIFSIVSRKHFCGHRFAETSWAADADKSLRRINDRICIGNQSAFIYINLRIERYLETSVSRIQVDSHRHNLPFRCYLLFYPMLQEKTICKHQANSSPRQCKSRSLSSGIIIQNRIYSPGSPAKEEQSRIIMPF